MIEILHDFGCQNPRTFGSIIYIYIYVYVYVLGHAGCISSAVPQNLGMLPTGQRPHRQLGGLVSRHRNVTACAIWVDVVPVSHLRYA